MQEPDCVDIEVFVGVNTAKGDHYACAVTSAGTEVLARSVRNDEASVGRLIDDAAVHGTVGGAAEFRAIPAGAADPDPDTHGEFQLSELGNFSYHRHRENALALVQEGGLTVARALRALGIGET